jgi:hypothetical protein
VAYTLSGRTPFDTPFRKRRSENAVQKTPFRNAVQKLSFRNCRSTSFRNAVQKHAVQNHAVQKTPLSDPPRAGEAKMKKAPRLGGVAGLSKNRPATSYSPTGSPRQYHPRCEA